VAAVRVLNVVAFFGLTFLMGLLWAPLVLHVSHSAPDTLNTAVTVTALIFTGLSAFVLLTGKDFSFLRGILFLGMWGMLIFGIAGAIFGFGGGLIYSAIGTLLFSGYILYDTSNILRRYPTNMAVSAAVALFTDVIYLFVHLLSLLSSRD
jgi:FtsH-binding integral membrane protein